ncbi:MAG: multiple sugar transport system substrate-binding protein [Cellvibrionaceae bacterium]|jgi:multiple sugar transport system substrate-binding protein
MKYFWKMFAIILALLLLLAACGGEPPAEPTEAPAEPTEVAAVVEEEMAEGAVFVSTQFSPVEEQEKFRTILAEAGYDFTSGEEGPTLDQILAGSGSIDVIGALHGSFPPLARENSLMNMADLADDLSGDRDLAQAYIDTGLLGTDDFLHYVPWMQATYIFAANKDALEFLPDGADVDALTWQEVGEWCANLTAETGSPKCGLPHAGLFHRFLEGYMFPSFTGGMVSNFRSAEAADMMAWARDVLWPNVHPESINYDFMQEPLQSGDVWVAFDHTARLIEAFNSDPDQFIAFPAPAGAAGRGFMPVIVGLGIPADAPNPEAGAEMIEFLTRPDVQGAVLKELGFFPVVDGVDFSSLSDGVAIEAGAVTKQATAPDALPALLPVGLGDRGGELNQIFRNAFDRIVLDGEDIETVLNEEGDSLQALMSETGAPCWAPDPAGDGPCQVAPAGAMDSEMMDGSAVFVSTQFGPVEEQAKFRLILEEGGYDFTAGEEGPTLDQIIAGSGSIDLIGALHGSFPPLAREDSLMNMIDIAEDLLDSRELAEAYIDTGLLGTDDFLHYVPWMQATYIFAASTEALPYLPDGADVDSLTWEQYATWCQNILDGTGEQKCGLPHAGLFHRFLEGYMFPSFTGGMVSNFRSAEATEMMTWARDVLWPTMNPESINYDFMQEPLQSGDVWVAFDHTARLIEAFNSDPDGFVAFPAPTGPAGAGFMPVIVGLGIPADAPDPEAAVEMIEFLTRPDVQGAVLKELGFFPVVDGVDVSALSEGVAIEAGAVTLQATSPNALPALLPVGLGDRGGELNQIFRNAFDRIVLEGEDIEAVLNEEGDNLAALMSETGAPCWAPDPAGDGPCEVAPAGAAAMESMEMASTVFVSTQFGPVEEQAKFRAILNKGGFDFIVAEDGPLLDQIEAGSGAIDLIGTLHGNFPPLARENAVTNMIDVAEDLLDTRELNEGYIDTGLLGTDDFLHYVPWMQATYIFAANKDALQYLPDGADVNALTWVELGEWCENITEAAGEPKCGLPHAGLFHRFLEGYLFPSFTGGMVSEFRSDAAEEMMVWARDVLWPNLNPESINYDFMQEPLQSGDVWVAFDHTARLIEAFNSDPDQFVAFPAPAGPAGSGFMPVIVGLGIPADAPDPEGAAAMIEYLTRADVQGEVLKELGFFPVVGGVDVAELSAGVAIEAGAVNLQATSPTALPALLPVGLGDRGGELNQIFRNAFDRIVLDGEDIATVLGEEGDNLQALMNETGAPCWAPDPAGDGPCVVNP